MQGEQLMDLDGYEKGYAHGWRDGRAEATDPGEGRAEALRRVEALIVKELPCNLLGCERMGTHIDEALEAFFEDIDADWSNDNLRPGTFAFRFRRAADRLRLAAYRTEPGETNA